MGAPSKASRVGKPADGGTSGSSEAGASAPELEKAADCDHTGPLADLCEPCVAEDGEETTVEVGDPLFHIGDEAPGAGNAAALETIKEEDYSDC